MGFGRTGLAKIAPFCQYMPRFCQRNGGLPGWNCGEIGKRLAAAVIAKPEVLSGKFQGASSMQRPLNHKIYHRTKVRNVSSDLGLSFQTLDGG